MTSRLRPSTSFVEDDEDPAESMRELPALDGHDVRVAPRHAHPAKPPDFAALERLPIRGREAKRPPADKMPGRQPY